MKLLFHRQPRQPKLGYERRLRCVGGYAKTRSVFFSDDFVSIVSLNLRNHIKMS